MTIKLLLIFIVQICRRCAQTATAVKNTSKVTHPRMDLDFEITMILSKYYYLKDC